MFTIYASILVIVFKGRVPSLSENLARFAGTLCILTKLRALKNWPQKDLTTFIVIDYNKSNETLHIVVKPLYKSSGGDHDYY